MAKGTAKAATTNDITADLADFDAKLASGEMSISQHEIAVRLLHESGTAVATVAEDKDEDPAE